ncbi:MAG: hypothetical protein J6581_06400 [Apibacter sp.]|jgi:hypothetical protein|nr:hypothetical protein [Apibacter sp.]
MKTTLENKIEKLKKNGYDISVNKIITDGFLAWKNTIFYGIFCVIFTYIFNNLIYNLLSNYLGTNLIDLELAKAISSLNNDSQYLQKLIPLLQNYISNPLIILKALLSSVIVGLLYPLSAGVVYCAYQIDKNGQTNFKDFISGYQGTKFIKLIGLIFIQIILISISMFLLFIPALYFIPAFILAGSFIIIDDTPLIKSIIYSIQIVNRKFGKVFVILMISFFISKILGIFVCIIGIIFTFSFSHAIVYSIYKNTVGSIDVDAEINEN